MSSSSDSTEHRDAADLETPESQLLCPPCQPKQLSSNSPPPPSPPPPPLSSPSTATSIRAGSRRCRVYVLRRFLLDTYPDLFVPGSTILDVAGGKGDLSWILTNAGGIDSVVVDPRRTHHGHLLKSVRYLLDHPDEAVLRAIPKRDTHQPLAELLPQLMEKNGGNTSNFRSAKHLRLYLDDKLVRAVAKVLEEECKDNTSLDICTPSSWIGYWDRASLRAVSAEPLGHREHGQDSDGRIDDATEALRTILKARMVVGFHPDQATEACIDLARLLRIPFAIVPCCVFPSQFPDRQLNGERVKSYDQLVSYLRSKAPSIRVQTLDFHKTNTAKKLVLYILPEDIT